MSATREKSGGQFFIEWAVGGLLGILLLVFVDMDMVQVRLAKDILIIASVFFVSLGALMSEQRYKFVSRIGLRVISLSIVLSGLLAVLIVDLYKRN
jgi:hypothetical protein